LSKLPIGDPRQPPKYNKNLIYALKALQTGTANEDQQQKALSWIIKEACETYDSEFRDTDRATAFAGGKRFVGLQIVKLLNMTGSAIETLKE
jgi:hypothetical protein